MALCRSPCGECWSSSSRSTLARECEGLQETGDHTLHDNSLAKATKLRIAAGALEKEVDVGLTLGGRGTGEWSCLT